MERWPIENHDVNVTYVITIVFCHFRVKTLVLIQIETAGTINLFTDDAQIFNPITTGAVASLQKDPDTLHS